MSTKEERLLNTIKVVKEAVEINKDKDENKKIANALELLEKKSINDLNNKNASLN